MQVHAFVLHLPRAAARRENAHALLLNCGIDGEIWPAVDGGAMSSSDLSACVGSALFAPTYPFALGAGDIGRFLSHRQIWAELQRREVDAALILEDDAEIDPDLFDDALDLARAHVGRLGYIGFPTRPPQPPSALIDTAGEARLVVPERGGPGGIAQLVSRPAAAHLLRLSVAFDRPVDAFVQCHWHTGLRPAAVHPSGIARPAERPDRPTGREPLSARLAGSFRRARYRFAVARHARASAAPLQGGAAQG